MCVVRGSWMGGSSDETRKIEVSSHSRCGTIKIPPCSKAMSAEHRPTFCSPSQTMVTSPYKWKILELDEQTSCYLVCQYNLHLGQSRRVWLVDRGCLLLLAPDPTSGIPRGGPCLSHSLICITHRTSEIDDCSLFMPLPVIPLKSF
jgi:hypothetical protein